MEAPKSVIGIAWYRKDQWDLLKATAADPEELEDTYESWEEQMNKTITELIILGQHIEKVRFDVKKFNEWCKVNGKKPDGSARSEYVSKLLEEKYK